MASDRRRTPVPSPLKKVMVHCSSAMKDYGSCVARIAPNVEKGMCEKQFLALKACMQSVHKKAR